MRRARETSLLRKVAFLRRPEVYPEDGAGVKAIETHMAWVFLTATRAWKLKKPVRYPYLDFSTLEARRQDCEEEVRLNRALAPAVYLGTVALTLQDGELEIGGDGEPVDWLVAMQRLDRERMLDRGLERRTWTVRQIDDIAAWLARFYAQAGRVDVTPDAWRARLLREIEEDRAQILDTHELADPAQTRAREVSGRLLEFVKQRAEMVDERVSAGCIVEGHGDLRPEHIFTGPPPAIIDCVEFNRSFRELDRADDLAFLRVECERLGASDAGAMLFDAYSRHSGDRPPPALIAFYSARRALLRAKIALWHLRDHEVRHANDWVGRALIYLTLAEGNVAHVNP